MTKRHKGLILAATGAALWGGAGIAAQFLLQERGVSPEWLTTVRMVCAGALLLVICALRGLKVRAIWQNPRDARDILVFALFGMLLVQYTYYACIAASNAPTATTLGYLMPIYIVIYTALRLWHWPTKQEVGCVLMAVFGSALLVTQGNFSHLAISPYTLFLGLLTGISQAVYTLQPRRLISIYPTEIVVGWGVFLGGLFLVPFGRLGEWHGSFDAIALLALIYIIIGGTIFAFSLYLCSMRFIAASEAAITTCMEPVASVVFSAIILGAAFGFCELLGMAIILLAICILARR